MLTALTPEQLAQRAQEGSSACFAELAERFGPRLRAFLARRTLSAADADDIAQETLVRAWRKIGTYDPRYRFSTWVFTIAARLAAAEARRPRLAAAGEELPSPVHSPQAGRRLVEAERRERLWALADRVLREDQRLILWLRYAEDMNAEEIARVVGKTRVGVRVALFRARDALAKHLVADGGDWQPEGAGA